MSLDDQLEPNDGGFIDFVDSSILNSHRKLGNYWQEKTGASKDILARSLHGVSSGSYLINTLLTGNIVSPIISLVEGVKFVSGIKFLKNGLDSEIELEAMGLPRKTIKTAYILLHTFGLSSSITGAGFLAHGIYTNNYEHIDFGMVFLSYGLGMSCWASGDYLDRLDLGEPPKKKKFSEIIKEKIQDYLPTPKPIPVKYKIN